MNKYKIRETIYFLSKNKICFAIILRIHIEIDENGVRTFYGYSIPTIDEIDKIKFINEQYCFLSKEELLENL